MPYSSVDDIPDSVKKRLTSAKKRRQWMHVFNSAHKKYSDEARAFRIANGTVKAASKGYLGYYDAEMRQVPQDAAGYNSLGANGDRGCANCQWFVSPNSCVLISGDISPTGLSSLYVKKLEYNTPPMRVTVVDDTEPAEPLSFLGNKSLSSFWQSIKSALGFGAKTSETPKTFTLYEDANDDLRFFIAYSNIFQDSHEEILSTDAHKDYVAWATKSNIYPELQIWHSGPGSKFGQCDFVDFVDGFCIASGKIDEGKEDLAYQLESLNLGASHSFVGITTKERGVWSVYRTFEISVLPVPNASNKVLDVLYTPGAKEYEMPFADDKKALLRSLGISDSEITTWEDSIKQQADMLKAAGVSFKSEIAPVAEEPAATQGDSSVGAGGGAAAAVTSNATTTVDFATKSELAFFGKAAAENAQALAGVLSSVSALTTQVKALAEGLEAVKKPIDEQVAMQFAARNTPVSTSTVYVASQAKDNEASPAEKQQSDDFFDRIVMSQANKALGL